MGTRPALPRASRTDAARQPSITWRYLASRNALSGDGRRSLAYFAMQGGAGGARVLRVTRDGDVGPFADGGLAPFNQGGGDMLDVRFTSTHALRMLGHVSPANTRVVWGATQANVFTTVVGPDVISTGALQLAIDPSDNLYIAGGGYGGGDPDGTIQRVDAEGRVSTLATFPGAGPIGDIDDDSYEACPVPAASGERASATVAAGGSVTTDLESAGDGATIADPIEATVTSPAAGEIAIEESVAGSTLPGSYSLLGSQIHVSAPVATAANPIRLSFQLDSSRILSSWNPAQIEVFRNGVLVSDCSATTPVITPDPCVLERLRLPDDDVRVTVLTSQATTWVLAVPRRYEMRGFLAPVDMKWQHNCLEYSQERRNRAIQV